MSSIFGKTIKISIFGQSHGAGIGVVIDGLPAGEVIDMEELRRFLSRRAPGKNAFSTARKEADLPKFISGLIDNTTCGAPLCAIIENQDTRSADYEKLRILPRPGHADYPAFIRYNGYADPRGGGHFSGRLTAPLCIAGGICLQILKRRGIFVGAHIDTIHGIRDAAYPPVSITKDLLLCTEDKDFPVLDDAIGLAMQKEIASAAKSGDSVGGSIACCAIGLPAGIGDPMFDGVENRLSSVLFGIPAIKGIEFGAGFSVETRYGSENNDAYYVTNGNIQTKTNHSGGILGGITTGMPLLLRVAVKPTPSIAKPQQTVNLLSMQEETLSITGRHDPCIVPRAVPCVQAAVATVLLDMIL